MDVLVTGGAGYIGSHVCKALALAGHRPVTLDNLSLGHSWAVKWGPLVEGDVCDKGLLRKLCQKYSFGGVIHLAALSNVRESEEVPLNYYRNNVVGSLSLLEVVVEAKIPAFVFSSTCAVYGVPKKVPIEEGHETRPINSYGTSKWMVEQMVEAAAVKHGLSAGLLRYFNAAGADLDGEIGEAHTVETHLIPLLMHTAQGKRATFSLYGNDHPTPDGTPIRDFIHVADLADAHVKALEWMANHRQSLTLNLGTGQGHSVREVIEAAKSELNLSIPLEVAPRFEGDPPILVANATQAEEILEWSPNRSDLSTILTSAWAWHKDR